MIPLRSKCYSIDIQGFIICNKITIFNHINKMKKNCETAQLIGEEKTEQVMNQETTGMIDGLEVAAPVTDEKSQVNQNGVGHRESTMDTTLNTEKHCCICGRKLTGYGNNPAPVFDNGRCCNECDDKVVIPVRMHIDNLIYNARHDKYKYTARKLK